MIRVYVNQFCSEIGCSPETIYNENTRTWYFVRGTASVEVFMSSYETNVKTIRTFMRVFAPVVAIPTDTIKRMELFAELLKLNCSYMGVKLATIPEKGFVYAVAERDIDGMDYTEFKTTIGDLGSWADQLDDLLQARYGTPASLN